MRSTGISRMYPLPPWICTARSATWPAISVQNSLAADGAIRRSAPDDVGAGGLADHRAARR